MAMPQGDDTMMKRGVLESQGGRKEGQVNGKAKIKMCRGGGEPAESIGGSKYRCHSN